MRKSTYRLSDNEQDFHEKIIKDVLAYFMDMLNKNINGIDYKILNQISIDLPMNIYINIILNICKYNFDMRNELIIEIIDTHTKQIKKGILEFLEEHK